MKVVLLHGTDDDRVISVEGDSLQIWEGEKFNNSLD